MYCFPLENQGFLFQVYFHKLFSIQGLGFSLSLPYRFMATLKKSTRSCGRFVLRCLGCDGGACGRGEGGKEAGRMGCPRGMVGACGLAPLHGQPRAAQLPCTLLFSQGQVQKSVKQPLPTIYPVRPGNTTRVNMETGLQVTTCDVPICQRRACVMTAGL